MQPDHVYDILKQAANIWESRTALVDGQGEISFRELFEASERLRVELLEQGVKEGLGLGLQEPNGRGFVIGLFAGAGTGATVMPISHQLKPNELKNEIEGAGLHAVLRSGILEWTARSKTEPMVPHVDARFVRFTSGTTGKSKGVVMSDRSVIERTSVAQEGLQLSPEDSVVWVLPMAFHFVVSIILYLRYGAKIIICPDLLAHNILAEANKHGGTLLYAAPMHIRLLASDQSGVRFTTLRNVISTSAMLPPDVAEGFERRYGISVRAGYGIIEVGLPILNRRKAKEDARALGEAMPSMEVKILDGSDNECPVNIIGKLAVRGPGMFEGYLNPPQRRQDILVEDWFFTGDLARKDASGLLWLEGREKSMINVAGNKVFPEEIEAVLSLYPGVVGARIFGVEHPIFGELVNAEVQMEEGQRLNDRDMFKFCNKRLSSYKVPQKFIKVSKITTTVTGKIKRHV